MLLEPITSKGARARVLGWAWALEAGSGWPTSGPGATQALWPPGVRLEAAGGRLESADGLPGGHT